MLSNRDVLLFLVYIVPVFIKFKGDFIWKNPEPNSVQSVILLEFHFLKENDHFSSSCFKKYLDIFNNESLWPFRVVFFPTMMDQKSINSCTTLKPGAKGYDSHRYYLCDLR